MAGDQDSNLDENAQEDLDGKSEAVDTSSKSLEKKQKTPEQIERERMRRRRRRQRQRIMRSLETKPEADKKSTQKPEGTETSADMKKRLEEKKKNDEKLRSERKQNEEKRKADDARKQEDKEKDEKKVDEPKVRDEVTPRDQQLRDETHPRVLDANVPPDMHFDKPLSGDQDMGGLDDQKVQEEKAKAEQESLRKSQEAEKRAADVKRKEKMEQEKAEKIRKEKEDQELQKKEEEEQKRQAEEQKKAEEEEKKRMAEIEKEEKLIEQKVQQEKRVNEEEARLQKGEMEEKSQAAEQEKAKLLEEEKADLAEEKTDEAASDEPIPVYHPEPEYITSSFAFEESKAEKPLSPGVNAEPELDAKLVDNDAESDVSLMSELTEKVDEKEKGYTPEPGEELIDVSEPVLEPSDNEEKSEDESLEVDVGKEDEALSADVVSDEEKIVETDDNPEDDTLVPADSVVEEVPIFPSKDEDVLPSTDDELTFGDSSDQNEGPSIPIGKMREDHAGSSPDLTLPYDGGPMVERDVAPAEGGNSLTENVEPESKEATKDTEENQEKKEKKEETNVAEALNEKKAPAVDFAMKLAKASSEVLKKIVPAIGGFLGNAGKFLKGIFGALNIRVIGGVAAILVVVGLGYWGFTQKWHEQAWSAVSGTVGSFFKPKPEEPKVEVKPNVNDERAFGITTALLFAQNKGVYTDRVTSDIAIALYYGGLQEPRVQGETGISAATFYGELKDQADFVNVYVEYVNNLDHMQSLYKTDVYKLLDQSTKRDEVLLKHLDELVAMKDKGLRIQEQIGINLDDLKVSYESLNGEKNKGETDFFAALSDLQGQKSDTLLKQFIEVSQKQVALKARIAALTKLQAYYATALARLDKRLEAIDKNRDALIQGIRVVDVPGSDLDLIIKGQ